MRGTTNLVTDEALFLDWQRGHVPAFDALYCRYHPRLFGLILPLAGSRPAAEAIVHAVFERVWATPPALDRRQSFESSLFAMARAELLAYIRRLPPAPAAATPVPSEPAPAPPADPYACLAGSLRLHAY